VHFISNGVCSIFLVFIRFEAVVSDPEKKGEGMLQQHTTYKINTTAVRKSWVALAVVFMLLTLVSIARRSGLLYRLACND
jgi:hypothetical protein